MTKLALTQILTAGLLASGQAITWSMRSVTVPGGSDNVRIHSFNSNGTIGLTDYGIGKSYRLKRNGIAEQFNSDMVGWAPYAINENDDIAFSGYALNSQGNTVAAIRLWNADGSIQSWQDPMLGGQYGSLEMWGMNENRQIVGDYARTDPDMYGACASFSPSSSLLLTPMANSFAKDISNDGTIVGMNEYRPGTWDLAGNYTPLPLPVGDTSGAAYSISESGYICGMTRSGNQHYMTIWSKSTRQVLYHVPSYVQSANIYFADYYFRMNENLDVVYGISGQGSKMWNPVLGTVDLKSNITNLMPGLTRFLTLRINDHREIAGSAIFSDGTIRNNLLLTPVPEPSEFAVMGVGIAGLLLARRRKK